MKVYPLCSTNHLYPVLFHKVYSKEEVTFRNNRKATVEREYVQGLQWCIREEEILPTKIFLKDVGDFKLAITDNIDSLLRKKEPKFRD